MHGALVSAKLLAIRSEISVKRIVVVVLAAAVVAVGGVFLWFNVIRGDAPEEFELTKSEGTVSGETIEDVNGVWIIAPESEAGYRVVEDLSGIQNFEAVGRTSQITGSLTVEEGTVAEATFEVDVASITSDDGKRDNKFKGDIMDADTFPTASFVLNEPLTFGTLEQSGTASETTAKGDLTLKDVTKSVSSDLTFQVIGDQIEVVGSIPVAYSDFGIDNPTNPFVTVRDEGMVEFKLRFEKQ